MRAFLCYRYLRQNTLAWHHRKGLLLSNQTNFDLNQKIKKENQLYKYTEIPIILFCIEKHAIKCFKFLLLNGSNSLETITDFFPSYDWRNKKKNIDGMTFGAEIGNLQIMQMIEEKGGKIDKNCIIGAAKFHQNHILKWIFQQNQRQQEENKEELILGLCSSIKHNNVPNSIGTEITLLFIF